MKTHLAKYISFILITLLLSTFSLQGVQANGVKVTFKVTVKK